MAESMPDLQIVKSADQDHAPRIGMLHVYDLPQLHAKPSASSLLHGLGLLTTSPPTFSDARGNNPQPEKVASEGVSRYLTSIISSSLSWLENDDEREQVWEMASIRLSERSGRNAMPNMTRSFQINDKLAVELFEPSMTEDNIGFKTWTSSLLLAKRLPQLRSHIPSDCTRVLELGAGTGLVGIAAACTWHVDVMLTDLPEIVPNLRKNVQSSDHQTRKHGVQLSAQALDWSDQNDSPSCEKERFMVILAADPIYTADHPRMLVYAVERWLAHSDRARFIVELPLRDAYLKEREDLKDRLQQANLELVEDGTEIGYDDWQGNDGLPMEVQCWWSVWRRCR